MKRLSFLLLLLFGVLMMTNCSQNNDWRTASRESAGIAPDPVTTEQAIVQVYGARAWSWRGWFAIHTWVAVKRSHQRTYTVYDVIGWRGHHGSPVMRAYQDIPDRFWYGKKPELLISHSGEGVDELIDQIDQAANSYPWKNEYKVFPGPNSNTFTAWVGNQVPALNLNLPLTAIGQGFATKPH